MSRSAPLAESRPARPKDSSAAESAHATSATQATHPAGGLPLAGPLDAAWAAAPTTPPRGGNHADYLQRRLGSGDPGPALPQRQRLEQLFGEPLGGLDLAFGVPAPGGRRDANAAARGNRVEFADRAPPLGVLAHELAHTVQARRGAGLPGDSRGTLEAEARRAARSASGGTPMQVKGRAPDAWFYDAPASPRGAEALRTAIRTPATDGPPSVRVLAILRENAAPADMARLRAEYGANFFADLKKSLDDTNWGEARAYLGAQLTLAENIQTRTGILIDDQAGVFETLERWPEDDALRMIEDAQGVAAPAPGVAPGAAAPAPIARASWAEVQDALSHALDADGQYRATQILLGKAERARANRPPPPPGSPAREDAVSKQRVAYAHTRILAAEAAGRARDAFLAIADLNAAERAALRPRLEHSSVPEMRAVMGRVRAIAGEPDDATALARALSAAGEGSGDISPAMLQHAAGRAGGMIASARARLAALPPTSSDERNRLTAELESLERRFHEGTLVQSLYFASHETGSETLKALGTPEEQAAQFTINKVNNFDELLAFIRKVPAARRLAITQSPWYQSKLTQVMGLNPGTARMNLLLAALYEGNPQLADTDFLRRQQAMLDAYDVERAWDPDDPVKAWIILSRKTPARCQALVELMKFQPDPEQKEAKPPPPLYALLQHLEAGVTRERILATRLRRGLAGEGATLLREDAIKIRGSANTAQIDNPRAYIESVINTPAAQAELRRGMVIRRRLTENPSLPVSAEDRALAAKYDGARQAAEQIGDKDPALREAFENVAFGEPDLEGARPGQDPAVEADFMHYRLEARLAAVRTQGSKATTDVVSWAGPTVDENAARFRVYYDQVRLRGIGRPELAQLADFYYRTMAALDAFAPANRAFASTAAQLVAAVAATVVVSAASGGSLGPVAVGALAAFVGGATAGLTGAAIRGNSTSGEVLTDVATGAVEGAVSVVGSALAAKAVHGATAGRAAGQAARMAGGQAVRTATGGAGAAVAEAVIDGAIGGAAGELFQTAIDEATWDRGVASALAALLAALARGAAMGAGAGLVGGLATAGLGAAWRRVAGGHGPQAVSEVLSAIDHISIGKADHLAGLSEPQLEALFRARRLALAGDDESAVALLKQMNVVPEGKAGELLDAFRARRKLVEQAAAEMGMSIDDPALAERLRVGNVMVSPDLPAGAAQIRYAVGLDGVKKLELWVGRGTRMGDVTIHQATADALRRWGEDTANLRGMLERVRAWARGGTLSNEEEVILELQKHAHMIEAREQALSGLTPGSDTARRLDGEIAVLRGDAEALQARLGGFGVPEGVIAGYGGRNSGDTLRPPVRVSSEPPITFGRQRFNDISELPLNPDGSIAHIPDGMVYEFPGGNKVWREGDIYRHDTVLGPPTGRRQTELEMPSASEHGRPEVAGMERAHTLGQGTGFESPFAIFYAPREVNQIIQNNGVEEMLRGLHNSARPGESFHVSTLTKPHPGTKRLAEIRYRVEVKRGSGSPEFLFEYQITVGREAPFQVNHGLANITEDPDLAQYADMVDVPQRLRSRFAMRSGGAGSAPVVEARNWPSVQHLIDQPVATAALPSDYIRQRSPDGSSWIIRRRDANDAEFQRLTVRMRADGVPVIAVWRAFE
ncbi:polymorphic toxin type 4 domain-containing protein [Zoogloea sp.]|uniref:polymorphic toxin type 4 domain-containing protein n=1 Tax=Zoogloea sp. TaxID=49181 RepID=UPI0035B21999